MAKKIFLVAIAIATMLIFSTTGCAKSTTTEPTEVATIATTEAVTQLEIEVDYDLRNVTYPEPDFLNPDNASQYEYFLKKYDDEYSILTVANKTTKEVVSAKIGKGGGRAVIAYPVSSKVTATVVISKSYDEESWSACIMDKKVKIFNLFDMDERDEKLEEEVSEILRTQSCDAIFGTGKNHFTEYSFVDSYDRFTFIYVSCNEPEENSDIIYVQPERNNYSRMKFSWTEGEGYSIR